MNYMLNNIPDRPSKPRSHGFTMMMDKGLSVRQVEDFIEVGGEYTDIVKLGWGTSYVSSNLEKKLSVYREGGLPVYFGGTLFEAFVIRGQFDDYRRVLEKYHMEHAEVSDGSITIPHEEKCEYIRKLSEQVTVISEVGSKDDKKIFAPYKWIQLMKAEIEAGSWKVIAEARESGNVGIYRDSGEVRQGLVDEILTQIPEEKIIWEAPQKAQQVYFIKLIGANVNLGNIAPAEIIPLETIRLGLRGDTFDHFLAKNGNGKNGSV
ncbi:MAG: phosphosulfolactate synthase [Mucilaginibacter polytrichastri]|nr:phosphosulfolactate synthase [Mucilaginibacter polytrichastri]